jgi:hypothetical protein
MRCNARMAFCFLISDCQIAEMRCGVAVDKSLISLARSERFELPINAFRAAVRLAWAWISFPGQNQSTALPDLSRIVTQVTAKVVPRGATPGLSMSGHLRFCFAAFVLLVSLSTSPASSNPFANLFNVAPQMAADPASPERECLPRPGKSAAGGRHWVYRLEGHRKCWFQAAEGIATVKKRADHYAAKHRGATPVENETARRKREAVVDGRAEMLVSPPEETRRPTPATSEPKVADAASVVATGVATLTPPALVANGATDQPTPGHPTPRQVEVETLLAAAPVARDAVAASVPPAPPVAFPFAKAGDDGRGWTANGLGMLLMALGLVSVVSSSRVLRGALLLRS